MPTYLHGALGSTPALQRGLPAGGPSSTLEAGLQSFQSEFSIWESQELLAYSLTLVILNLALGNSHSECSAAILLMIISVCSEWQVGLHKIK